MHVPLMHNGLSYTTGLKINGEIESNVMTSLWFNWGFINCGIVWIQNLFTMRHEAIVPVPVDSSVLSFYNCFFYLSLFSLNFCKLESLSYWVVYLVWPNSKMVWPLACIYIVRSMILFVQQREPVTGQDKVVGVERNGRHLFSSYNIPSSS